MKIYDIAVIGAGPAGSTLVKELLKCNNADNFRIILIDARPLDKSPKSNNFKKPCGGLLSPSAQKYFARKNITLPNKILANPQSFGIETIDFNSGLKRTYQRLYLNMDREAFDRWLIEDLNSVDKIFGERVLKIEYDGNFIIKLSSKKEVMAKMLVGADGAASIVRKTFFNYKIKEYLAIQEIFEKGNNRNYFSCYFDKNISDYYGWSLTKDNKFIIGIAIPKTNKVNKKFEIFKNNLKNINCDLSKSLYKEGTLILRPSFFHKISVSCEGKVYLIGEAGGYISPSSAEGISYALNTADILSKSILKYKNNYVGIEKEFKHKMRMIQFKIFIRNVKSLFINISITRYFVMKLGIKSLDII